jgi:TM2 domain-containing membrane protein YozV
MDEVAPTKQCPKCGETILAVAIRCKHCQSDLAEPDFDRGVQKQEARRDPTPGRVIMDSEEFEQRFLEFAYKTNLPINAPAVAYALKIPIAKASEGLEDLAAADVLIRSVDDLGNVSFRLPGRPGQQHSNSALVPYVAPGPPAVTESNALAGLLLNALFLPGLGSLVMGRPGEGVGQLVLFLVGIPLCFVLVGFPMIVAAWTWGLMTGIRVMNEAKTTQQQRVQ